MPPAPELPRTQPQTAPLGTAPLGTAPLGTASTASGPRVRERGHLTLVDWEGVSPAAPAPAHTAAKTTAHASPLRRTWVDRAYDRAALILLAVTALGVAASLVQH